MKGPVQTLPVLWHELQHAQLWGAIGTTLRRALIGYSAALVIGSLVGALVSRIKPLRAAVGSIITGLQTMPSIAWFPFAIIFFGLSHGRDPVRGHPRRGAVDRQRADRRAWTTPRRCCCGPGRCSG